MSTLIEEKLRGADPSKLTLKQKMFVKELLANPKYSITEAAKAAGYRNPSQAANKLMHDKRIASIIGKEVRLRGERLEFKADQVLERLRVLIELDITEMFDSEGYTSMKKLKRLPGIVRQCITKIKVFDVTEMNEDDEPERVTKVEVEWMSKDAALQLAMKHFNLLQPDVNITLATDKAKEEAVIDMLEQIGSADNVIDATEIKRIANEAD